MNKVSTLIIDDSDVDRYLLKRDLDKTDFKLTVFEREDGEEALEFFIEYEKNKSLYPDDYPPMVVFLDINMPRMNGYEFLEEFSRLREKVDPNLMDLKSSVFIIYSSSDREEDKKRMLSYDCVKSYLVKGQFTSADLSKEIMPLVASS